MPISNRVQWRALAAIGALLVIICVWPFNCTAVPLPLLPNSFSHTANMSSKRSNSSEHVFDKSSSSDYSIHPMTNVQKHPNLQAQGQSTLISEINVSKRSRLARVLHVKRKQRIFVQHNRIRNFSSNIERDNVSQKRSSQQTFNFDLKNIKSTTEFEEATIYSRKKFHHHHHNMMIESKPTSISRKDQFQTIDEIMYSTTTSSDSLLDLSSVFSVIPTTTTSTSTQRSVFIKTNSNGTRIPSPSSILLVRTTTEQPYGLSRTERSVHISNNSYPSNRKTTSSGLERNERSANLSHITGTARKIQLLIKNRLLQILPDGTVNGTLDDGSDFTILQRATVDVGQIRIQGVATCLFLCMDACGNVYGAKEFTNDCIFNETMQDNFNIYSSSHHSNCQKTFYLALNKLGQTRKTHLPANKELGKLATYAKSFTFTVPENRSEDLIARLFGINHIKHGLKQLCDSGKSLVSLTAKKLKPKGKCPKKGRLSNHNNKRGNGSSQAAISLVEKPGRKNIGQKCGNGEQNCAKKKKKGGNAGGKTVQSGMGSNPKGKLKKQQLHKKGGKKTKTKDSKIFTTTPKQIVTTTTEIVLPVTSISPNDDDDLDNNSDLMSSSTEHHNSDDDWDETTVPSNGQTSFADDYGDYFDV